MMPQISSDNQKSTWKIFKERTKKPFVFISVCLLAAFALYKFQSEKANFDKEQSKPWVVVDNLKSDKSVNQINSASLFKEIGLENPAKCDETVNTQNNLNKEQTSPEQFKNEQKIRTNVICRGVEDVKYQEFKNKGELISKMTEVILTRKERDLDDQQNTLNKSRKEENEIEELKAKALTEFDAMTIDDEKAYIDAFIRKIAPAPAQNSKSQNSKLNTDINELTLYKILSALPKNTQYTKAELRTQIENKFDKAKERKQEQTLLLTNSFNKFNKVYPSILGDVYAAKDNLKAESLASVKDDSQKIAATTANQPAPSPTTQPANAALLPLNAGSYIFDDKAPLSVIYQLVRITLLCIIVFGLVYIILIPLQHIFFLTAAGEAIKGQAGKLTEKKDAAATAATTVASSKIAGAVITTITVITVGTVVVASNEFGNPQAKRYGAINPEAEFSLVNNQPKIANSYKPEINPDSSGNISRLEISALVASLNSLSGSMTELKTEISGLPLEDLKNLPDLVSKVDSINNTLHNAENLDDERTVMGNLRNVSGNIKDIGGIKALLKNETDNNDPKTVFGKLNEVSNTLTTADRSDANTTVLETLQDVSSTLTQEKLNGNDTVLKKLTEVSGVLGTNRDKFERIYQVTGAEKYKSGNSIFENLNLVADNLTKDSIKNVLTQKDEPTLLKIIKTNSENNSDLSRYLFANSDGNFFTQLKNTFKGERHQVTRFTCNLLYGQGIPPEALNSIDCAFDLSQPSASEMPKAGDLMMDDKLLGLLEKSPPEVKADKEKWNMWKQLVLRFTRVARY